MALFHVFSEVENRYTGVPMSGVQVRVRFNGVDTLAPIYANENGAPFTPANYCVTDDDGMYSFYVDSGVYDLDFLVGGKVIKTLNDYRPAEVGPTGPANSTYTTTSELENSDVANVSAILSESGKAGTFTIRDYPDFSAEVAADMGKINYIRSVSDNTKVWVRTSILPVGASQTGAASGLTVDAELAAKATLAGVARTATDLGTFTGSTIPDNAAIKAALQAVETAVENTTGNAATKANATAIGVAATDSDMGIFSGSVIPDNQTAKQALQFLETDTEQRAKLADLSSTSSGKGAELIGAIQTASGAIPRTAMAKLRDIVSVTDFGTNGTYTAQAAAAAASNDFNVPGQVTPDLFVMGGFTSNADPTFYLATSSDGETFSNKISTGLVGRDASVIVHNGEVLVAVTGHDVGDFVVYRSKDLKNWTTQNCTLGASKLVGSGPAPGGSVTCNYAWAPEWLLLGGSLYILISLQYAANQVDITGASILNFRGYVATCTNRETLTFSTPTKLNIPDGNKIDHSIIQNGATLFMLVKDEYDKKIETYSATALAGPWTYLADVPANRVEGPSAVKMPDGTFNLYFDYYETDGELAYVNTSNFSTFGEVKAVISPYRLRHGTAIYTGSIANGEYFKKLLVKGMSPGVKKGVGRRYFQLTSGSNTITPQHDAVYYVTGSDRATVTVNASSAERFYFLVQSSAKEAGISVLNSGGYKTAGVAADVFGYTVDNNSLIAVQKDSGDAKFSAIRRPAFVGAVAELRVDAGVASTGSVTINGSGVTWRPTHGAVYTSNGGNTGAATIAAMDPNLPIGFSFGLIVYSGVTDGRIVLSSSWLTNAGGATLDGSAGYDGRLIWVTKVSATMWSAIGLK